MPVRYSELSAGPSTRRALVGAVVPQALDNYSEWTKGALAAELEARGLPKSGTKAELVARLREADE